MDKTFPVLIGSKVLEYYGMNCEPQEIIFTSGGTESDNMILRCAVKDLKVRTIISSLVEHHAVLHALDCLENETGEIIMDKETIEKARIPVERMAAIGR